MHIFLFRFGHPLTDKLLRNLILKYVCLFNIILRREITYLVAKTGAPRRPFKIKCGEPEQIHKVKLAVEISSPQLLI